MADTPERRPTDVAPPAARPTGGEVGRAQAATSSSVGTQRGKADEVKEQTRQQANRLAEQARQRGKEVLQQQKGNAADQLKSIASALHRTAKDCESREAERGTGRLLDQAANGLDRLADSIRERDIDSLFEQTGRLMRRQPAAFIGATVAAGFLLSRFLKSSSERSDYEYRGDEYDSYGAEDTYDARETGAALGGQPYVTGARANPGDVTATAPSVPPVTPTGRRDY